MRQGKEEFDLGKQVRLVPKFQDDEINNYFLSFGKKNSNKFELNEKYLADAVAN